MSIRVFDPDNFLNVAVTAINAREIASVADSILCSASFVLYGRYVNGKYVDFTCEQKANDTHCVLGYLPKQMKGNR